MNTISEHDDIIDSRDVAERIDELADMATNGDADDDDKNELQDLLDLKADAEGYAEDWEHGVALIRDSYFKDYAMDIAEDIGAIDHSAGWPMSCIDWDQASRELQMDYTAVEFAGVLYWVR